MTRTLGVTQKPEAVVFEAGPEFGELKGRLLKVIKAQCGLKSPGKMWHDRLHDVLTAMGWIPSKAESDIWMKDCGSHYECIAVCVDNLLIASKKPQEIIDALKGEPNNFKLKGTRPVTCHLGCDSSETTKELCVSHQRSTSRRW